MNKLLNDNSIYDYDEWNIVEEDFKIENNARNETVFALGNGYIGMRGTFVEGYSGPIGTGIEGTYLNGFYESEAIKYGEIAYGYPEKGQTMLNVANSKIVKLFIEDEEFDMLSGKVLDYKRTLSLKEGILKRNLIWRSPEGKEVKIEIQRFISFENKHLAAISYEVTPLNFHGKIKIISALNGNVSNLTTENDPRVGSSFDGSVFSVKDAIIEKSFGALTQNTKHTKFTLVCAMENEIKTKGSYKLENIVADSRVEAHYIIDGEKNKKISLSKYISYITSRDYEEEALLSKAREVVNKSKKDGFNLISKTQRDFLLKYWNKADVVIKGDLALQQGIRFNMFHLLQSVGRDGKTNIAAKGLTGEGYEGHYFWDTEIYMLPFFLLHHPEISRKLLEYRYSILDKARERARQMSHDKGALYPWRTIDGEECSAYYPAGTAQYHINADIAFAIKRYMEVTEDTEFLTLYGAEILFETARLWADLGDFVESKGNKFCINAVTGPDEYTAIVNNNCYTNLMAKENLEYAYKVALWMKKNKKEVYEDLVEKLDLEEKEVDTWKKASVNMYIPYNEELGLYPQDDSFFDKAVWDFENTPKEKYPLLIHYHPLVIYRYQVCKQADLVLALFLLSEKFTNDEKKKNYDYYEKITTHDSSLSSCIFSIVASDIGYHQKAYEYFMSTARMDLDDYHGNTKHGIHAANMAGAWMCVVNGFAGLRIDKDNISFKPYIPEKWEEYGFKTFYRGNVVEISVNKENVSYELVEGQELEIAHFGKKYLLKLKKKISVEIGD